MSMPALQKVTELFTYNLCLFTPPFLNFEAQWKMNQQEHKELEKIKMCEKETGNLGDLGPGKIFSFWNRRGKS